ncbi:uncharacterized protein LOC114308043 [Camellia sinensis]|uniref:uncharacterized protein LOC114308043 n=1 Tax=Camellia sinensis TaxID=4442 RepID=UPI001035D379|nr:uncharacterized protein LOC114308043 [Camellia sinensis]
MQREFHAFLKKIREGKLPFLNCQPPSGGLPGVNNQYVSYINKLRECWYSGKNAVVFDNQERVVKVILFILSLQDDTLPLLIITTSTSLCMWEAEFSRHESSINVVVYKGSKDVRASIRSLEFYDDLGCVMFQVLLSPPDVVESIGSSGLISIGDILDDFVHQRFGKDSYAHIDGGEIIPSKKRAALDLFNGGRSARKKYKCLPRLTDKIDNSICISDSLTVPPAAHGISRGSDGTNASALEETVIEAGQRVRAVIPITREAPTSELIGTSLPTMQPQIFPDQGSEEHPHQAQVSIHPAREGSTGNSSQYMTAVQAGNNHLVQSSPVLPEVPRSDCSDSLLKEMERIQKDKEQAIKLHEDTKLWLKAACEKEIDAVRKRYDMLLRDSETALVQEKKDLETYYNKVYANKLLAKALTEKYDDAKAAGSHGTQQVTIPGFMNEISQLYHQQTASRSKSRLKQSSASLPMTSPPVSPPIQVETHSSEVHQTAGRTTLGPEQSTTNLPMTGAPTIPPAQLVNHAVSANCCKDDPRTC